jgi:bifunctional UDP-N-acetylglucosamine pyrophosphorylase/glucosamine-1-phosphate N-acetyltransferase
MKLRVSDLFSGPLEPDLTAWLKKFEFPIDLLNALPDLFAKLNEQCILGEVREFVSITGPVHIGEGSVIHPGAIIDGPVIIGDNVCVRSHAQIRKMTFIGSDCVIGHGADIKASLCLNSAKIQDGTFVGESIVGYSARIGSGAILANRKFNQSGIRVQDADGTLVSSGREFLGSILGDYVRIGANCVLSPGTIIGPHTWVGSGLVLLGTYPADVFITAKQEVEVRPKERVFLRSGKGEYETL